MYNLFRVILAFLASIADVHCSLLDRDTEPFLCLLSSPKDTGAIRKHWKWSLFKTS